MQDDLAEYLDALARDQCYRVDAVLKESPWEVTERVYFKGANGSELGPFVRKRIDREAGIGSAYASVHRAQRMGRRFAYLPRIIECHEAGDRLVVVMEHVGGETLADVVRRCDPSEDLACDVFPRLCDAVGELHEGFAPPLIHRDLKPSNIMLSHDGTTIIDFGIARTYKEGSEEDTRRFGTRAYAPPEQFGFGQTDVRSDVYSLGMLLYFLLTEEDPDAKARADGWAAPGVPEAMRRVIAKAAAFDPDDRYASVGALKEAFSDAVGRRTPAPTASATDERRPATAFPAKAEPLLPPPPPLPVPAPPAPAGATPVPRLPDGAFAGPDARRASRVPFWAGVVWDVFLAFTLASFAAAALSLPFDPEPGTALAEKSFAARLIDCVAILLGLFVPVIFFVRDRRPLHRLFPRAPRLGWKWEALVVAGGAMACFVAMAACEIVGI